MNNLTPHSRWFFAVVSILLTASTAYVLLLPPAYQSNVFILTCSSSGPDILIGGEYNRWKLQRHQDCIEVFVRTSSTEPNRSMMQQVVIDALDLPENVRIEWELALIPGTGLFQLTVEAESPRIAQAVADELAHHLIEPFNNMDNEYAVVDTAAYPESPVSLWNRLSFSL